jgi:hypothetical protein
MIIHNIKSFHKSPRNDTPKENNKLTKEKTQMAMYVIPKDSHPPGNMRSTNYNRR